MAEPRDSLPQVCGMRPACFSEEESWGVRPQAVPCLAPEPENNPWTVLFSSVDVARGDRQQKGKLAFSWHVNFCSSGTKEGPSAHCVSLSTNLCWISAHPWMGRQDRPSWECPGRWRMPTLRHCVGQPTFWTKKKKTKQWSPSFGTFLEGLFFSPLIPGLARLIPGLHTWVCHCEVPGNTWLFACGWLMVRFL